MNRVIRRRAAFYIVLLGWHVSIALGQRVNPDSQHIADFEQRLAAYVKLRNAAAARLPGLKPTDSPDKITAREHVLAQNLRSLRSAAKQGDIFTPQIAAEFRRLVRIAWRGSNAARMRHSLARAEPVAFTLHVNDAYPTSVPLQSTPPTLLQNLPSLPKEVEYRIVGHNLVLRDATANLVVDFIERAIP